MSGWWGNKCGDKILAPPPHLRHDVDAEACEVRAEERVLHHVVLRRVIRVDVATSCSDRPELDAAAQGGRGAAESEPTPPVPDL
jgi:hypothetical protein